MWALGGPGEALPEWLQKIRSTHHSKIKPGQSKLGQSSIIILVLDKRRKENKTSHKNMYCNTLRWAVNIYLVIEWQSILLMMSTVVEWWWRWWWWWWWWWRQMRQSEFDDQGMVPVGTPFSNEGSQMPHFKSKSDDHVQAPTCCHCPNEFKLKFERICL